MVQRVGGKQVLRISLASLVFFIIILAGNIYLGEEQGMIKPVIQSIIATLVFYIGLFLFQRNK